MNGVVVSNMVLLLLFAMVYNKLTIKHFYSDPSIAFLWWFLYKHTVYLLQFPTLYLHLLLWMRNVSFCGSIMEIELQTGSNNLK